MRLSFAVSNGDAIKEYGNNETGLAVDFVRAEFAVQEDAFAGEPPDHIIQHGDEVRRVALPYGAGFHFFLDQSADDVGRGPRAANDLFQTRSVGLSATVEFEEDRVEKLPVVADVEHACPGIRRESCAEVAGPGRTLTRRGDRIFDGLIDDGVEDILFAGEVIIERPFAELGLLGDLVEGGVPEPLRCDEFAGGLQDILLAGTLDALLGVKRELSNRFVQMTLRTQG